MLRDCALRLMIFRACTWCGKQSGLGISRMYEWLQRDQPGHLRESAGCCSTIRTHAGQPWSTCTVQSACRPCIWTQCPWPTCIVIPGALSPASLLFYFFLGTWVPGPQLTKLRGAADQCGAAHRLEIGIHDGRTDIWALWKQRVRLCTGGEL